MVDFLMKEQEIYSSRLHDDVMSNFTIVIGLLTILNCILVFLTLFDFKSIDENIKNIIILILGVIIVGIIIFLVWAIFIKLRASRNYTNGIIASESIIVNSILIDGETDLECIRRRYKDIWNRIASERKKK